jgi:pseudaminic acid synthase
MNEIVLSSRRIADDQPCYIVAEMSANHHQELSVAHELIHAMHESGADAVKLQTYTPDSMTIDSDATHFRIGPGTLWEGRRLHALYAEAATPWEWHAGLFELARSLGLDCFSSPFDRTAVDFLETLDPPAYKIASFELVDLPLIEYTAARGRPMIMSTGMASLQEISEAVDVVRRAGVPLALLKCTSAYPAPAAEMNLRTIPDLGQRFQVVAGLSDHTMGEAVPVAAVALGARIIEKHFTLSRKRPGPDSAFSLEPAEFRAMVDAVRVAEAALGSVSYQRTGREQASIVFRRSLFVVEDVPEGGLFTDKNIRVIRPGNGLAPRHLPEILGRRAACPIRRGTPLQWSLVQ